MAEDGGPGIWKRNFGLGRRPCRTDFAIFPHGPTSSPNRRSQGQCLFFYCGCKQSPLINNPIGWIAFPGGTTKADNTRGPGIRCVEGRKKKKERGILYSIPSLLPFACCIREVHLRSSPYALCGLVLSQSLRPGRLECSGFGAYALRRIGTIITTPHTAPMVHGMAYSGREALHSVTSRAGPVSHPASASASAADREIQGVVWNFNKRPTHVCNPSSCSGVAIRRAP
ncbi:hypothetical protein BGY98DRAFT_248646 [Russula aff. rugulosa BPL654]|nr:hypothetical protein BGY98DRAFT_248646 [Russula aff. rugulosa BPL654]